MVEEFAHFHIGVQVLYKYFDLSDWHCENPYSEMEP